MRGEAAAKEARGRLGHHEHFNPGTRNRRLAHKENEVQKSCFSSRSQELVSSSKDGFIAQALECSAVAIGRKEKKGVFSI